MIYIVPYPTVIVRYFATQEKNGIKSNKNS